MDLAEFQCILMHCSLYACCGVIMSPLFTSFEGDKPDPPGNISIGGTAKIK